MKTMKLMSIVLGLVFILSANAQRLSDHVMQEGDSNYKLAVQESLSTLRAIVNDDNAEDMGFRSARETQNATPGTPMSLLMVQLDDLRKYRSGSDVRTLLKNHQQYLVPILVNNEVRSSITLERKENRISAISYGAANLVRSLEGARQQAAKQMNIAQQQFYAVHVAALSTYFVAYDDPSGQVMLVPIHDDKELNFKAGGALIAEEAILRLQPVAMRYNDLPI